MSLHGKLTEFNIRLSSIAVIAERRHLLFTINNRYTIKFHHGSFRLELGIMREEYVRDSWRSSILYNHAKDLCKFITGSSGPGHSPTCRKLRSAFESIEECVMQPATVVRYMPRGPLQIPRGKEWDGLRYLSLQAS
jgi:hypothetical protein